MTISELGFAMKAEACQTPGETILVSKDLWVEIADLLVYIDRRLDEIERAAEGAMGKNGK